MNRALMITGEYPPVIGGIGDYTSRLMNTQEAKSWILFYKKYWNVFLLLRYIKEIIKIKPDCIFMQYPTRGYAWSFSPYLLCLYFSLFSNISFIPVVHEYSQLHIIRKIQMTILLFSAKKIIAISAFEMDALIKRNKKLRGKIKILKTVPHFEIDNSPKILKQRYYDIAYFGLISKNKGIEVFIDAVSKYKKKNPELKTVIIGGFPDTKAFRRYSAHIVNLAAENYIETIINKTLAEISKILVDTKILLLPFPDGCSERRGTFISGLNAGCVVITTKGKYTTNEMLETAFFISDNNQIENYFDNILLDMTEECYIKHKDKGKTYLKELPSWNEIAREYNAFSKK